MSTSIVFAKVAPWPRPAGLLDDRLIREENAERNGGATQRFAYVGERMFRIERESWGFGWYVTEVFSSGLATWVAPDGTESIHARAHGFDHDLKFLRYASRLSEARRVIIDEVLR